MFGSRISLQILRLSPRAVLDISSMRSQSTASQQLDPPIPEFKTLAVTVPKPFVFHVELNRPEKLNALNHDMWCEIKHCFEHMDARDDCRVVVLSGKGRAFTSGLDFSSMTMLAGKLADQEDVARRCKILRPFIEHYQQSMSSLEKCCKPVISLVHGLCIGAGVDIITAADIRYSTTDAKFSVKEADIGMAADVGTLQRLPKVIGSRSLVNELVFTARMMEAKEALSCGLVSRIFDSNDSMMSSGLELAENIASKSPVGIQTAKRNLVYSRDHTVQEGLDHIADLNMTMLQSEDFINASMAQATRSPPPPFAKL